MPELGDESVHLVVTSPPYWKIKDYGTEEQIGFHDTYEDYLKNLNTVWSECHRVLHKGCRLCVNIGDQYTRTTEYGRHKVIPIHAHITAYCDANGFDYMGSIIWQKVSTCNTTGGAKVMGSYPYPRNGIIKKDYEYILVFKKHGADPTANREVKDKSRMTKDEWKQFFSGHWHINGERQGDHPAMFPQELPRRLIRMYSYEDDTILDPFLGSGTTMKAAANNHRISVGYEINEAYLDVIKKKVGVGQSRLDDVRFNITKRREQ
jgi:site-specific DNA-methyltransferase (adenine-specific)